MYRITPMTDAIKFATRELSPRNGLNVSGGRH